jgi:hypothetical protein
MAAFLGDRLDLAGRHDLHVHLGQRRHQRLLGALVALEEFSGEAAVTVLRHAAAVYCRPPFMDVDPDTGSSSAPERSSRRRGRPY